MATVSAEKRVRACERGQGERVNQSGIGVVLHLLTLVVKDDNKSRISPRQTNQKN